MGHGGRTHKHGGMTDLVQMLMIQVPHPQRMQIPPPLPREIRIEIRIMCVISCR